MKRFLALLLVATMALTLMAVPSLAEGDASLVGGQLIIGMVGDPYALNGWVSNDLNAALVSNILYPSLMVFDENAKKVPYILESYEVSEDLKTFTAKIHDGIFWHDGEKFTAEDLAFTANYCSTHDVNFGSDYYANVDHAEALDALTVQYTLKAPQVNFITDIGFWVDVMPKHLIEGIEDFANATIPTIGYGPFKMDNFSKGEYYTFSRVANWPLANGGVGAYLDGITIRIYTDVNALMLAIKSGEVDCGSNALSVAVQQQLDAEPDLYGLARVNSLGYGYFSFSFKNPMLADPAVRKAIAQTIDRDALVNIAIQGGGVPMLTPISPVYKDLSDGAANFPAFDIDGAKATLEAAGYVDSNNDGIREKDGQKLAFTLTCRNNTNNIDAISNIFKANCAEAGIDITISIVEPATYTDLVTKNKTYEINYIEWGVIDEADTGLDAIYHSAATLNFMQYKNEAMDKILEDVKLEGNYDTRKAMMLEFQKLFVEELPSLNVLVRVNAYGFSKQKFEGWSATPGLYGVCDVKDLVKVHAIKK